MFSRFASRSRAWCAWAGSASAFSAGHLRCEGAPKVPNPLHHLDPELQLRGRAPSTKEVGARLQPQRTHVVRIALTGGPCAGKSSALEHIIEQCKAEGYDVYCAPETATIMFNSGVIPPSSAGSILNFQLSLARVQLQMERSLTQIAERTGRPSIIVFDRGLLDGKGYMEEASWEQLLTMIGGGDGEEHRTGVDEAYLLARYDAVIHLVTAADGAEKFYKSGRTTDDSGNAVIRGETPEQARAADRKMREIWSRHANHIVIPNSPAGFKAKLDATADAVLQAARRKHP